MLEILLYALVGTFAGLAAGLLGVGGGIVNVPALDLIFLRRGIEENLAFHLALGTSLAIIIVTSGSAVVGHYRKKMVDIGFGLRVGVAGIAGAVLGSVLASLLTADALKPAFGLLLVATAAKLLIDKTVAVPPQRRGWIPAICIGLAAGLASGFFGIGGGIAGVPLLILVAGMSPPAAVATSSLVVCVLSLFGAATYAVTGHAATAHLAHTIGYVHLIALIFVAPLSILTARLGVSLAHAINPLWLKRLFAVMLLVVGGRFVWHALHGG